MANAGLRRNAITGQAEGTNGSQFFITVPGQGGRGPEWLQGKHTIFGEVADDASKAVVDTIGERAHRRRRPPDRARRASSRSTSSRSSARSLARDLPTTFRRNSDNFCYRHPDRQSFVLCQRCLRTICPECQTQGAVGVICPECLRRAAEGADAGAAKAERRWSRPRAVAVRDSRPLVTYGIIGVTLLVYLTQLIPGSAGCSELLALQQPVRHAPQESRPVPALASVHGAASCTAASATSGSTCSRCG